jgi:serine protease Do
VVRLGRIQKSIRILVESDCTLVGGDSGGPLFDMDGKVIGIHSRIGQPITANVHVPVNTFRESWDRLIKGDSWASLRPPNAGYIGISFAFGSDDLVISDVTKDSPADKAGLKVKDVVTGIDGNKLARRNDLAAYMDSKKVDEEVALDIRRDSTPMTFKIKLARRPED